MKAESLQFIKKKITLLKASINMLSSLVITQLQANFMKIKDIEREQKKAKRKLVFLRSKTEITRQESRNLDELSEKMEDLKADNVKMKQQIAKTLDFLGQLKLGRKIRDQCYSLLSS